MNSTNRLLGFELSEYKARVEEVKKSMRQEGMDVLLINNQADSAYLTGYPYGPPARRMFVVIFADGEIVMIERLVERGNIELILGKTIDRALFWEDDAEMGFTPAAAFYKLIGELLEQKGVENKRVGVQKGSIFFTALTFEALKKALPRATFMDATTIVEKPRLLKSPAEIECLRRAARIASKGCAAGIESVREGVSENELTSVIMNAMLECPDYEFTSTTSHCMLPHVTSGPRAALAHTTWSGRIVREGDTVYLEVPASVNRYHAVILRTVSVGSPTDKIKNVGKAVADGLGAAIAAIKPGVRAGDVDKACRGVIEKAGFGEYFRHRTAYTIGLEWVQQHGINLVPESPVELKAGMTFHIIPVCMFFGEGAVGMSDSILVTEEGAEVLTELDRKLYIKG